MGSWGAGIYENDDALDFFGDLEDVLFRYIVYELVDSTLTDYEVSTTHSFVPAAIDIIATLRKHYDTHPCIPLRVVRKWRELYLAQFDAEPEWDNYVTPDGLDARTERRKVIEATFDRLEALTDDD